MATLTLSVGVEHVLICCHAWHTLLVQESLNIRRDGSTFAVFRNRIYAIGGKSYCSVVSLQVRLLTSYVATLQPKFTNLPQNPCPLTFEHVLGQIALP